MVDRIDIDALLIGSLYGELSSADEARLKAHLESHPADRTALEGLSRTRAAVRTSRIFELQLEPPQSVSALLLQEAVRRAPRKAQEEVREGWFARLRRSLLVHPAMAAATMLVLVLGVASTLYLHKGDHFANPDIARTSEVAFSGGGGAAAAEQAPTGSSFAAPPAAPAPAPGPAPADPAAPIATATLTPPAPATEPKADPAPRGDFARAPRDQDSYRVGLAEGADVPAPAAKPEPAPAKPEKTVEQKKTAHAGGLLEVTTPQRTPKELDDEERPAVAVKGRAQSQDAKGHRAPDAAPGAAPPAAAGPSMAKAPPSGGAADGFGGAEDKLGKADPELAWARDQHSRLIGQVRAGRCTDAAGTAVALSNRAPGYYQQNVENDRSVKECLAYINAERERAAERAQRARAATARRATEESPPAAAKQATQKKAAPAKAAAGKADSAADAPAAAPADSATKR